jgi:hypothetical protein
MKRETIQHERVCDFSLTLNEKTLGFTIPNLEEEITFSFDPPRPNGMVNQNRLLVRIKKTGESKRVELPCRLNMEFQRGFLAFAKNSSLFWVDLTLSGDEILGKVSLTTPDGNLLQAGGFTTLGQPCPLQTSSEFVEGSPFKLLSEAKWWGRDLFRKADETGERVEILSQDLLEIREEDWLVWQEGKWQKNKAPDPELPIAHIQASTGRELILEGWGPEGHTRLALAASSLPPFKVKAEELFSSIRIRSEKQISCILEKQCLILKMGDWVLKSGGRWKILRKKDERDAFLNGKLFGELFILEQIAQKQGQKVVQGRLFNPSRTQVVSLEIAAHSARKMSEKAKGKGRMP